MLILILNSEFRSVSQLTVRTVADISPLSPLTTDHVCKKTKNKAGMADLITGLSLFPQLHMN